MSTSVSLFAQAVMTRCWRTPRSDFRLLKTGEGLHQHPDMTLSVERMQVSRVQP